MLLPRSTFIVQSTLLLTSAVHGLSSMDAPSSCAVVGVGALGTRLCRQILETTDWHVTGITKTVNRHDDIRSTLSSDRLTLVARDQVPADAPKYDNVVFCAPPSGSDDYPGDVKDAVENLWAGQDGGGVFAFTSTGGIYSVDSGIVTESTPITGDTPRVEKFVQAEGVCRAAGGCAVRLAGLYDLQRGPHNYYLTIDKPVKGNPDGLINMLHYDDAAGACLAALQAGPEVTRGNIFLISDGNPVKRRHLCESAVKAAVYRGMTLPEYEDPVDTCKPGKVYDGSVSNKALKWSPRYESFDAFMEANA